MFLDRIILGLVAILAVVAADEPLSYAPIPNGTYVPARNSSVITVLDLLKSREDCSILLQYMSDSAGFAEAFDAEPSWTFTFFAPSDAAFNNTGSYFHRNYEIAKGKFWFGNLLQHHYVSNSALHTSAFNSTYQRLQMASYLYTGVQQVNNSVQLNHAVNILVADLPVTNGIVHVIDHILDPSAMIFEADLPQIKQSFIPGGCSNPKLPYC